MTRRLEDFIGRFGLSRVIEDRLADQSLRFEGRATISATDQGAIYAEAGKMTFPNGQTFQSERSYLWAHDGALVRVCFEDGRAFHDFDPVAGGAASEHLCGQDMYRGGYEFGDWPRWSLTWAVSGPRKDYTSCSMFTPLA